MSNAHRLSTHVLDTRLGRPAAGLTVMVFRVEGDRAALLATRKTDDDGRVGDLLESTLRPGTYRIVWDVGEYAHDAGQGESFFSEIVAQVRVADVDRHYHVPLILSPHSGMTYLGS